VSWLTSRWDGPRRVTGARVFLRQQIRRTAPTTNGGVEEGLASTSLLLHPTAPSTIKSVLRFTPDGYYFGGSWQVLEAEAVVVWLDGEYRPKRIPKHMINKIK
jgi:hypothetical protein